MNVNLIARIPRLIRAHRWRNLCACIVEVSGLEAYCVIFSGSRCYCFVSPHLCLGVWCAIWFENEIAVICSIGTGCLVFNCCICKWITWSFKFSTKRFYLLVSIRRPSSWFLESIPIKKKTIKWPLSNRDKPNEQNILLYFFDRSYSCKLDQSSLYLFIAYFLGSLSFLWIGQRSKFIWLPFDDLAST